MDMKRSFILESLSKIFFRRFVLSVQEVLLENSITLKRTNSLKITIEYCYKYFVFLWQICIFDELDAGSDPDPARLPDAQPRQLHRQAGPAVVIPDVMSNAFFNSKIRRCRTDIPLKKHLALNCLLIHSYLLHCSSVFNVNFHITVKRLFQLKT